MQVEVGRLRMRAKDIKRINDAGKMGYGAGIKIRQTVVWRCKDIGSAESFIKILEEDYPASKSPTQDSGES